MTQRLVAFCDMCDSSDGTESFSITINDLTYSIDFCKDHIRQTLEPVIDLLNQYGHFEKKKRRARTPSLLRPEEKEKKILEYECSGCGRFFDTPQGRAVHISRKHLKDKLVSA